MPGELLVDEPAPGVARLTISNPDKRGALDHTILDAIADTLPALDARCTILTGSDGMFSAGYDIGDLDENTFVEEAEKLVAHPFTSALEALDAHQQPTLAALGGHAIGGGLELALTCDLRIAAHDAKLGMPPAKLGLVYSHTGLRRFIDTIGVARTRELFLLARNVDAPTAERWGMVNWTAPRGELPAQAVRIAAEMARMAPMSQRGNKRMIAALLREGTSLSATTENELLELRKACFASADFREGVRAFGEKRIPRWRDR